jgi:hypothetical protein
LSWRNGTALPTVIENRYQAVRAKAKLYRLKDSDPLVHACRQAVERAKEAAHYNG